MMSYSDDLVQSHAGPVHAASDSVSSYSMAFLQHIKIKVKMAVMVAHAFNPSTQETDTGRSLSSKTAWSIE